MPTANQVSRESPTARAHRLQRSAEYRAERLANDPAGFRARNAEKSRQWRHRNPESAKKARREYFKRNPGLSNAMKVAWRAKNPVRALFIEAKSRAKGRGIEFTIEPSDIPPMGDRCPLLGTPWPLQGERYGVVSPSIDRIDSSRGYVPGNVWIVGRRANMVKNDGTAAEHEAIARAMRSKGVA